jgi:hypothetical protein
MLVYMNSSISLPATLFFSRQIATICDKMRQFAMTVAAELSFKTKNQNKTSLSLHTKNRLLHHRIQNQNAENH